MSTVAPKNQTATRSGRKYAARLKRLLRSARSTAGALRSEGALAGCVEAQLFAELVLCAQARVDDIVMGRTDAIAIASRPTLVHDLKTSLDAIALFERAWWHNVAEPSLEPPPSNVIDFATAARAIRARRRRERKESL